MSGRKEVRGGGKGAPAAKRPPFLLGGFPTDDDDIEDDGSLEAELLALTGGHQSKGKEKPKGKSPLPMEAIEKMAALCMQDIEDDDGEELDDDEDLLAELDEVLGDEVEEKPKVAAPPPQAAPSSERGMEGTLTERLAMYKDALTNAKQGGESSKARRYERGVKTLEDLIRSVQKGKSVSPEDIPPPVAVGKTENAPVTAPAAPLLDQPLKPQPVSPVLQGPPKPHAPLRPPPQVPAKPQTLPKPVSSPAAVPLSAPAAPSPGSDEDRARVLERQREYKLAALQQKREGDTETASKYYRIAKSLDPMLSAMDSGDKVDIKSLPPPPDKMLVNKPLAAPTSENAMHTTSSDKLPVNKPVVALSSVNTGPSPSSDLPPPPRDTLEALQQRMDRYRSAAEQAKGKGDDRKARMHERIVKQYQDAIRSHKAGKAVNLAELPVPPGFPPIQGSDPSAQEQSIVGVLETAMRLANQKEGDGDDDSDEEGEKPTEPQKLSPHPRPAGQPPQAAPKATPSKSPKMSGKAQQQLDFLEGRRKQLLAAALRSKQQRDLEGAKNFLRQSKGLDPMIEAARGGLPVDITKVPPAPINEADFSLDQQRRGGGSLNTEKYQQLMEKLKEQHEMCVSYSRQFTHLGNITETAKYEKLAEECMKYIELLKQAHSRGLPVPGYHFEERTINIMKIFPELSSSDLVVIVAKAVNLPIPSGSSPHDMDTFVRFEFAYPSMEEAQKDKTNVIKSSNSPVFKEKFTLHINRNHRGLKRAIQAKGIKFEIIQKGGLFKSDRLLGTSLLKLEALEGSCEIRDIMEVMDGRKTTGGKLEVIVRIREPLSSQQLSSTTEKWLVIDPITLPPVSAPKPKQTAPVKPTGGSTQNLHSLTVLAYEKEKLEKKMHSYKQQHRAAPDDLVGQINDITRRSQQQIQFLRQGGPSARAEYVRQLERYLQFYGDAARRLGQEGNREAAKDALYKRTLVTSELHKFNQ
ncbi:coiled-coil and C2 domain-containing protein 1A [Xenopus tropicalis]|uniref:Coiled-coil and C2 domain-containing protein 1B n=1 Tax=Xenopus tropicalis TaxID=8364 RepID=B1H2Q5_XENTR|nr:coiled-coil and C2 domain-containing protein 1A [Xenopus tropicalis]AAI61089.1 LOC100145460 protein [Xenopus tropicalis]|eukprot:NP_001120385.1 coiled-coil and C2 domain-containing protein 1A [Xenopus tropicalis]